MHKEKYKIGCRFYAGWVIGFAVGWQRGFGVTINLPFISIQIDRYKKS